MIRLSPYYQFEDQRGLFLGITQGNEWHEINIVETNAGVQRGEHYHKQIRELFYIVSGEVDVTVAHLETGESEQFTAQKGDIFIVEPYELHTFRTRSAAVWINMLSQPLDQAHPDIFRVS